MSFKKKRRFDSVDFIKSGNKNSPSIWKNDTFCDLFNSSKYINTLHTFYAYHGAIPDCMQITYINMPPALKWLEETYAQQIEGRHIKEYYDRDEKQYCCENVLYILKNKIIIDVEEPGMVSIAFDPTQNQFAKDVIKQLRKFTIRRKKETPSISVIINKGGNYVLETLDCPDPKLSIEKNYNQDLEQLDKQIQAKLKEDKSGLYMIHGAPGTGKTTYIRHLISKIKKQVIFLSPKLAGNLDSPELIKLLIDCKKSVLIIEDAELLISSRDTGYNSAISMLLNITDGLLGESLGIQVICTFNTDVANIDKALLRKGRLLALYEFKGLEVEKSKKLLHELGNPTFNVSQPMTLAEIYNTGEKGFAVEKQRKKIGFSAGA